jgi:hypothetical protein
MTFRSTILICGFSVLALSACSQGQKEQLGLVKQAPDEFAVVTRAPLSVPPEYTIRPPRPGAQRPMEQSMQQQARQTLFGVEDVRPEEKEAVSEGFMERIGTAEADSNIRERLESENETYVRENKPVAEKLLFWRDDDVVRGDILDAKEEHERLNEQSSEGEASAE